MVRVCALQERAAQSGWRLGAQVLVTNQRLRIISVFSCVGPEFKARA